MPEAILIVDGTSTNRKLAERVLSSAGYDVRSVPDAAAALDAMPEFLPKLVLTDLRLEGMDGLTLTRRIKEDPRTRQTLVIAVTGRGTEGDRRAALKAGCDDFIVKPINTRTLPVVVRAHLARKEQDAISLEEVAYCASAELPPWALELCHDFIHEGAARAGRLLKEAAPAEIKRVAHVWVGLGDMFGFPEITKLARQLQDLVGTSAPASADVSRLLLCLADSFSQAAASLAGTQSCLTLPPALAQSLSSKKFLLVGFDDDDSARLTRALVSVGGQVLSRPPAIAGSDLTIAAAGSEETAEFLREFRDAPSQPLLLVETRRTCPQVEMMLDSAAFDFATTPWRAEEILARAHRLLTWRNTHGPSPQPSNRVRKLRVVIADDDPTILTLLKTTVQCYGMDCSAASEGDRALALMRASPPDAAILDINMPNMDGLEVLAAIRNDANLKHIPVLLLSSLQQESDIVRGLGLGADDYVTKPFSPVEIVARLKRMTRSGA